MLMANLKAVLSRPTISENYSRNAFDRSFSPKLTYQLGGLQPFFAEQCIAGSHIKLNRSIFQRTASVNTAAFPKVDTHCEFFYVPIRLLWSYWNNWKLNIRDYGSSYQGSFNSSGNFSLREAQIPTFDLNLVRDCINGRLNNSSSYIQDLFGNLRLAVEANRLMDSLGYGFVKGSEPRMDEDTWENFLVNPFKLLAYQKVYYDHFRNTAYERNDPSYYNWDFWSGVSQQLPMYQITKAFTYRYVNYRRDYFTSLYPALNYVKSDPTGYDWSLPNSVVGAAGNLIRSSSASRQDAFILNDQNSPVLINSSVQGSNSVVFSGISVQQIRAAFALDKLMRATSYAPKHVKDQFQARYGVEGVESGNESVRIGAYMNDIVFQEVVNTAANLGEIGAKGIGSDGFGEDIEFTCKEDCIILGLMYSLPRSSYDTNFCKNWNAKFMREDFFMPEYMNLGLQPLYRFEFDYNSLVPADNLSIMGYQSRYQEYKCGIDENHGIFQRTFPLSDFVNHTQGGRSYVSMSNGVDYSYFKVSPNDLDSVFAQSTDVSDMTTDKFITYMDIKFICNQNMSVHGQPTSLS